MTHISYRTEMPSAMVAFMTIGLERFIVERTIGKCAVVLTLTVIVTSLMFVIEEWTGRVPFFVCFAAAPLIGAIAGFGPAVFGVVLTTFPMIFYVIPPDRSFIMSEWSDVIILSAYIAFGLFIGGIAALARRGVLQLSERRHREGLLGEVSVTLMSRGFTDPRGMGVVANAIVPQFCDWCYVDLIEGGQLRRVAIAYADPAWKNIAERFFEFFPKLDAVFGSPQALRSGRSQLIERVDERVYRSLARSPEHLAALREQAARSGIIAIVKSSGRTTGILTMLRCAKRRAFDEDDLHLAEEIAARTGGALEHSEVLDRLEAASRARSTLLAAISHDLRNPLTAIELGLNLLERSFDHEVPLRDEVLKKVLSEITQSTRRLGSMLNELVEGAQNERGETKLMIEPTTVGQCVLPVLSEAERIAVSKQQVITTHIDAKLGLTCDVRRIQRVLSNLVGNALKFTPAGGRVEIRVVVLQSGHVEFTVEDNGPGIALEEKSHVFERFWQSAGNESSGGLGLGLAICRTIVEEHGGQIRVESQVGEGARFIFELPIEPVSKPVLRAS